MDAKSTVRKTRGSPNLGIITVKRSSAYSDRGCQYTAQAMVQACADAGLRRSMGATGICWDNSGVESLWSTFKHEYYYRHVFATKSEIVAAVDKWMHYYNNQRRFLGLADLLCDVA